MATSKPNSKTNSKASRKSTKSTSAKAKTAKSKTTSKKALEASSELERVRAEAHQLESLLEEEILRDAVMTARVALEQLKADTHGPPFERRRGIRLRDKALKVERAFNRLRALRRGELLPERHPED